MHLKVGNQHLSAQEVLQKLQHYQLLPQLVAEIILDGAIANISLSSAEEQTVLEKINAGQPSLQENSPSVETTLIDRERRKLQIEKFKHLNWDKHIDSYFLQRKSQLDRVVYSLIRSPSRGIIQELFFRLQEQEQTFAELAPQYSQGPETLTKGLVGPVEINKIHPSLAKQLSTYKAGQVCPPLHLGEWWIIVQLEQWIPAQLDEDMRKRLMQELFEQWLQEQVKTLHPEICP